MAKVIAEAKDNPEVWRMQCTCTGKGWNDPRLHPCYRLIEIDATDIYKRKHIEVDGSAFVYYGFICPACGIFNHLSDDTIPHHVRLKAKNYEDRPKTGLDFNKM